MIFTLRDNQTITIIEKLGKGYFKFKFNDKYGYEMISTLTALRKSNVVNPFVPSVCGVGFLGKKNVDKYIYSKWKGMIYRCYDQKHLEKFPTYKTVTVCEEWLCYANFEKWFNETYVKFGDVVFEIDKDLKQLNKTHKIYSPETCVWLPKKINYFIINHQHNNSSGALGVSWVSDRNNWLSQIKMFNTGKTKNLGRYNSKEQAYQSYLKAKLEQIECAKNYMRSFGIYDEDIISLLDSVI